MDLNIDKEILPFFLEETTELLEELKVLGASLKPVRIPNEEESRILADFAQKLNRLIGGSASVGLDMFAPVSRKTSLLAEKCADIKEMTIRTLISNLNFVVVVLSECFNNLEAMKEIEAKIPDIEARIDICMAAIDLEEPEIIEQGTVDDILSEYDL